MDAYQKYQEGLTKENSIAAECNAQKIQFYSCVNEKKTDLSKSLADFSTYRSQVRNIQEECFESNNLGNCKSIFNKLDVLYY